MIEARGQAGRIAPKQAQGVKVSPSSVLVHSSISETADLLGKHWGSEPCRKQWMYAFQNEHARFFKR